MTSQIILVMSLAILLILLLAVITWRTLRFRPVKPEAVSAAEDRTDAARAAEDLSGALKIRTISNEDFAKVDSAQFELFREYLRKTYPKVHSQLEWETVNTHSLLYRWRGKNPERKPVLLMAHYDVVPVDSASETQWTQPPFSGNIADGVIWGRGALDIKCQVIGVMEAVETLLEEGYAPERDVHIAFGHDEEVDGQEGARRIAELLERRGLEFEFILDEGSYIADNTIPGIERPLALIGLCEKGYADVRLSSESSGGHSSTPPGNTALGIVSEGVARLQRKQFPRKLTPPVRWFLDAIGPEMPLPDRILLANLWLFRRIFQRRFSGLPSGNALLRTTTAATMAGGSLQANILPQKAWAVLNFRLLNGETKEDLERHLKKVLRGLDVRYEFLVCNDPSAVSPRDSESFRTLERTIRQIFPDALPTPYIMTGASDSIKYERVSRNIFRFSPYRMKPTDIPRIHGLNECIPLEDMAGIVRFYRQLVRNL